MALVNIACGNSYVEGWLNFDYAPVSSAIIQADLLGRLPLDDAVADVVYSSHFFEHIPRRHVEKFLAECFRVMKPGGKIRLVLPDLDEMCREYLRQRDAGAHEKADFVALEMLDQCVRNESGGELGAFCENLSRLGKNDMMAYVAARTGEGLTNAPSEVPLGGQLWRRLQRLYCRALTWFLPTVFREQNVSFAGVGERHAWIYSFYSLSNLLEEAGFAAIRKMKCDQSEIVGFPLYPLDITGSGQPRKGLGSMYVEAQKP